MIELIATIGILLVLSSAAIPMFQMTIQHRKESELRYDLREMRNAIDRYKDDADKNLIRTEVGSQNYPPDLQTLVDGVAAANDATGRKLKFLRRVPIDPMTKGAEWGLRSYQDDPKSTRWGGQDVFDVHTTSEGTGLDGTKYKDW
jgi:general secretion pathway protein G